MYCKKCGTQIDDDSEFCKSCGAKQTTDESSNIPIQQENKKSGLGCGSIILVFIIIMALFFVGVIIVPACSESCSEDNSKNSNNSNKNQNYDEPQLFTRDARNSDIEIQYETNLSALAIDIVIMPNVDIEKLELKIQHYDKNGNMLLTQYKEIGNVKEGVQVKTQIKLTDFSLTDFFKVETTSITVNDGTVSYFQ